MPEGSGYGEEDDSNDQDTVVGGAGYQGEGQRSPKHAAREYQPPVAFHRVDDRSTAQVDDAETGHPDAVEAGYVQVAQTHG